MLRLSTGLRNNMLGGSSGDSFQNLFSGGVMRIYSGTQPADADYAETGTLLLEISLGGATFVPGASSTNGLTFDDPSAGVIEKAAAEDWQGDGIATANAGWFRFYSSERTLGASSTAVHFDGSIATSGGQLSMTNTLITASVTTIVTSFSVKMPGA